MKRNVAQRNSPGRFSSLSNESFNWSWISRHKLKSYEGSLERGRDSRPFEVVWLRNLDRLISAAERAGYETSDSRFVDIGCGVGIPSLYAAHRYAFLSVGGFDLDQTLVDIAVANSRHFNVASEFWVADAQKARLPTEKQHVFLFNPFGTETAAAFLDHNVETLRRSNSIVLLANDHLLPTCQEFGETLWRNQRWNCSIVKFWLLLIIIVRTRKSSRRGSSLLLQGSRN